MNCRNSATRESASVPVQLHYCPRCGALCVAPPESDNCPSCRRVLAWIYGRRSAGLQASTPRKESHAPAHR